MATTFDSRDPSTRRKRDKGLGAMLAELDQKTIADPYKSAQGPVTRAQVREYGRNTLAPTTGDRAYSAFRRTNTTGNARGGDEFRTFVKRDDQGNAFRYHEYNEGGKRRVVKVGKSLK